MPYPVLSFEGGDLSSSDKEALEDSLVRAVSTVAPVLEEDFKGLHVSVTSSEYVIPDFGCGAMTFDASSVQFRHRPGDRAALDNLARLAYPFAVHELSHVRRWREGVYETDPVARCVFEGLATVLERDYGGWSPPWSAYDTHSARVWLQEVARLGVGTLGEDYLYDHPDGRRWIAYKTGTYVVDEAISTGADIGMLTSLPATDITEVAGLTDAIVGV